LKKRSKKLLLVWACMDARPETPRHQMSKSFLLLFFKKEALVVLPRDPWSLA